MKYFFRFSLSVLCFAYLQACQPTSPEQAVLTPLERSQYSEYTSNAKLISFLQDAVAVNSTMQLRIDTLSNGALFPVVFINGGAEPDFRIMMLAQQHGNEPSGMEGLLLLIKDFANGSIAPLPANTQLLLLPQCNPYGAAYHQRRNDNGIDLNRDHLLMQAEETIIIQDLFDSLQPHMTVDFHEYYPYSKSWEDFGYRRNFDIQLGGLTNINTAGTFRDFFYRESMPFVKKALETESFSFFEYTLGNFALGERLRRSTVDINDGRQSFGIAGTYAMIVEGMNGRDSLNRIEQRAISQYITAKALLTQALQHADDILLMVHEARQQLLQADVMVSIRMDHFPSELSLSYPLLHIAKAKDTVFNVEAYHPVVRSLLNVSVPHAYLIPKKDSLLMAWLGRSNIRYSDSVPQDYRAFAYRIKKLKPSIDEELANIFPEVEKVLLRDISLQDYVFVPCSQLYRDKLVTALEPQSMYGLASYEAFGYLLSDAFFPIIRLEK